MSLIINSIINTVKTLVHQAPEAIKGAVKQIRDFIETDGQHDRRIREMNRRELKQSRREMRMERRRGTSKERALHPNQMRHIWAMEEWAAREMAALDMMVSAMKNGGGWESAFKAYVAVG